MESTYVPKIPDDETLIKFWGDLPMCPGKDNIQLILNNKYYHIGEEKKSTPRQSQKGKLSKKEWFEGLEIVERVQAVSTIVIENYPLLQAIKDDIHRLENKNSASSKEKGKQNSNHSEGNDSSASAQNIQNWEVVMPPELPGWMHEVINRLTFLDTKAPEDTVSVQEDLVADPVEFFHTIKSAWGELLEDTVEHLSQSQMKVHKLWRLTYGENFNAEAKMLWGKVLSLFEIALHNSYSRAMNDKRNYNPKSFLDPKEANWKKTEKIFLEYLDLKGEILHFLQNSKADENEADEFLKTEEALLAYNVPGLKAPKDNEDQGHVDFYNSTRAEVLKDIREYRTHLTTMIRPSGDAQKGYTIFKNQMELYQVLNESRIYQNNRYSDDRIRQFARYLFEKMTKKGDDLMADQLILEFSMEETKKEEPTKVEKKSSKKGRKRGGKNKQSNQQKKEKSGKGSNQQQSNQSSHSNQTNQNQNQKQKQKLKSITPQKGKKSALIEEEKKLADELTATERSSKVDPENDFNGSDNKPESIENQSINDAIKDLEKISLFQETKSECDKEDEYKLENDMLSDYKAHHDADKLDHYLFGKNKIGKDQIKVSSLSTKECDKIGNAATNSESEGNNSDIKIKEKESQVKEALIEQEKKEENLEKLDNLDKLRSPKSEIINCISHSSEVMSLMSEEKRLNKVQNFKQAPKTARGQNQRKPQNDPKNKKGGKNKKGKQNKNKNKRGKKQQQNQKQNVQKKKQMPAKQKKPSDGQNTEEADLKCPTLSKAKTHDMGKDNKVSLDSPNKTSEQLLINKEEGKDYSKNVQFSQEKQVEGPPQFFNPKLVGKSGPSDASSMKSSGSFEQGIENLRKKSKSQNFQTKTNQNTRFTRGQWGQDDSAQSLDNEETKGQSMENPFGKFQKHANYEGQSFGQDPNMPVFPSAPKTVGGETPQHLEHNLPAYAYQVGSYHTPQPMYNQEYNQMNDPTYRQYIYEIYIYQKISAQITEETRNITLYSDLIQKYRIGIKKEIEGLAKGTFGRYHKKVEAHIYGSVATELALPESDMDLMVTGVNSFGSKSAHEENISSLHSALQTYFPPEVLTHSSSILNTQVPIIKLKFNLQKYYEIHDGKGDIFVPFINFDSTDASGSSLKELAVDISMSDSYDGVHMGLKQNAFVKEKLEQYPVLRPVWLTLKKLLIANGFNDPYTGGLGSYGLFIMLYAALWFENMNSDEMFQQETAYKGRLFIYFLSMYSPNFDVEKKWIFFFGDGMPIVVDKFGKASLTNNRLLCVYDPTDNKNNVTSKAFRIKEIQEWFEQIKNKMTLGK